MVSQRELHLLLAVAPAILPDLPILHFEGEAEVHLVFDATLEPHELDLLTGLMGGVEFLL